MGLAWYLPPVFKECTLHVSVILGHLSVECINSTPFWQQRRGGWRGGAPLWFLGPRLPPWPGARGTPGLGQYPGPATIELFGIVSLRIGLFFLKHSDL